MLRTAAFAALSLAALPSLARADSSPVPAATWTADASHSAAQFSVRHMMVSTVRGQFSNVQATVTWDGTTAGLSKATVEATIPVSTINTREDKRDAHLKSPDFFDVAKFADITFKSKKVASAGKGHLKVTGELSIHGVTKEVVLDVEGPTPQMKDPWGNVRTGLQATTVIDRTDFGLTWNKAIEGGGVVVGPKVQVLIDLELLKK
jgi:polyisoprenoid-binding protein YceI